MENTDLGFPNSLLPFRKNSSTFKDVPDCLKPADTPSLRRAGKFRHPPRERRHHDSVYQNA